MTRTWVTGAPLEETTSATSLELVTLDQWLSECRKDPVRA